MSNFKEHHDDAPLHAAPGSASSDWELAAAACELALLRRSGRPLAPLPVELAERIRQDAPAHLPPSPRGIAIESVPEPKRLGGRTAGRSRLALAGWCTAACLAGVLMWQWMAAPQITAPPGGDASPSALADLRRKLLTDDPEAVTVSWKAGDDPAIVADKAELESAGGLGDVVWSSARQEGFMRFRGLAANDPTVAQYQLWIFDAERNEAYPVDGGVFDVPPKADSDKPYSDIVVRIDPRLPVSRATAFAVTVEKPGGVVVSSRDRLPLLAAVP